jgi:hypothetical protein
MKLSQSDLRSLYDKTLKLVKNKPPEFFNLRKMRGTVGLCYYTDIELDYRKDIIATAFHELFHYLHPEWSESMVKYAESRMINFCSSLEIATFLKHLANKIYKAELRKDFFNISASSQREKKSDSDNNSLNNHQSL